MFAGEGMTPVTDNSLQAGAGAITIAGQNAGMTYGTHVLQAGAGAFALAGQNAGMTYGRAMQAGGRCVRDQP